MLPNLGGGGERTTIARARYVTLPLREYQKTPDAARPRYFANPPLH